MEAMVGHQIIIRISDMYNLDWSTVVTILSIEFSSTIVPGRPGPSECRTTTISPTGILKQKVLFSIQSRAGNILKITVLILVTFMEKQY